MHNFSAVYHLSKASDNLSKALVAQRDEYNKLQKFYDKATAQEKLGMSETTEVEKLSMVIVNLMQEIKKTDEQEYASETFVWFLVDQAAFKAQRIHDIINNIKQTA